MNVVDSSAWMSWISDDRNAQHFAVPILDIEALLVPTVTLTEVFKSMLRQTNEGMALQAVTQMKLGRMVPLDSALAVDAANYGLSWKLPLADSIIYATARRFGAILWTQDADFKDLPGVKYFP
jgi:predicted nucleic acid-binding protein